VTTTAQIVPSIFHFRRKIQRLQMALFSRRINANNCIYVFFGNLSDR